MKNIGVFKSFFYLSIAIAEVGFGATNSTITQVDSQYDADTTLNINIDLNNTPSGGIGCNANQDNCYTGGIFSRNNTLTLNNNATLTINLTATGNYGDWAAVFFRGQGGDTYQVNGGTFVLNLLSLPNPQAILPVEGVFITRRDFSPLAVNFVFNSNVVVTATEDFYITRGIFNVNDGSGGYSFNKNTHIDVSRMQESLGWKGSGVGYRSITSVSGDGYFYVNYDPVKKTTINRDNVVQLLGDIAVELQSTARSEVILHLTNPQSFFQGRFSLQGQANAELLLDRGGKWILTANSAVRTLNANNNPQDLENQYGNHEKIAAIDFTQTTDNGIGSRLTSDDPFQQRTLEIRRSLRGKNGVFRLMADVPFGQVDTINVTGELQGKHYVQVFQNGKRLGFNVAGKNMVVARANTIANGGNFVGLKTIAGLYDYDPTLIKRAAGGGTEWLLGKITYTPNQTAKTLFNILSTPYRIFRLHADNLNHRIEDLLYPPTKFGVWAKMYGGGIHQRNDFDKKSGMQDLFFAFQGGFDYGETMGDMRYFFGGSLDYLQTFGEDIGFNGNVSSFGFGAYGGYIQDDELFIDAKLKYVFSAFRNNLYQAQDNVNFYGSIFLANFRIGYSFYPFRNKRSKTIQICKTSGGNLFCRNDKSQGYVKDPTLHIQPFVSITPGIISGHSLNFIDKVSNYNVLGKLDLSPALIASVGVMGIKRYEYNTYNVQAKALLSYSYDINLGGKITLIDDANIPLFNRHKDGDHRITLGLASDVLFFNDSLKVYGEFRTEFLGRLNTYWIFSGGVRYKFGQPSNKRKGSLSYRPKSPAKRRSLSDTLSPYQHQEEETDKTFNRQNHFREMEGGTIRSR